MMFSNLKRTFDSDGGGLRLRLGAIYAVLIVINIAVWAWAFCALHATPMLLGTAFLAYGFGLRHAVDADHIAAIDNVTRKLMQDGKTPVTVGFWFAIGHSAVVILLSLAIAVATTMLTPSLNAWKGVGSILSASVSTLFLLTVAAVNVVILRGVWRTFRAVRRGLPFHAQDFDLLLNSRGLLTRLFRPLFRLVSKSWHMLPLGFLFGLGFDTATEVGLLGMSATQADRGMSAWTIMLFPALFAAGMSLVDTSDGVLMLGAYQWAFVKPLRKLYYNLVITAVSVVVAVLIGGIEGLNLLGDQFGWEGGFWDCVGTLNDNFNGIGLAVGGLFVFAWFASVIYYRYAESDAAEPFPNNG